MPTALLVLLNVLFIAFVLVTIVGLCAWSIVSDRTTFASIADRRARLSTVFQRRARRKTGPARRRPRRGLDLAA